MLGHKMLMAAAGALKKGIEGVFAGSTVIDTSSADTATAYSNQRKIDRCQNGVLWAIYVTNFNQIIPQYSTDDGVTWTAGTAVGATHGSGGPHTVNASFFIDLDDYAHLVYKSYSDGYIYYRRGTPNAARTSWTWSSALQLATYTTGEGDNYPDIVAHREGTGWAAHVIMSRSSSSWAYATYCRIGIDSSDNITLEVGSGTQGDVIGGDYSTGNPTWPSIDFHHTGDGKTVKDDEPHLFVAWSAGDDGSGNGIRFKKATYSSGSWSWGTEREIDSSVYVSHDSRWLNCLFDGKTIWIGGHLNTGPSSYPHLYDRDVEDASSSLVMTAGSGVPYGSMTYTNDHIYMLGTAGGTDIRIRYYDINNDTNDGDNNYLSISGSGWISFKRGYSNNRIEFIYTDGSSSPYDVTYGAIE